MLPRPSYQPSPAIAFHLNPSTHHPSRSDNLNSSRHGSYNKASLNFAPQQYALPIHRGALSRRDSGSRNGCNSHDLDSEQTLRRKTPGGTLAAGYDARSTEPPASKHLILSEPDVSTWNCSVPINVSSREGLFPQGRHRHLTGHHSLSQPQSSRRPFSTGTGSWSRLSAVSNNPAIFDQVFMNDGRAIAMHNGTRVPTVMPAAYQYSPGPTASNSGGMPGPYWPNGSYVPYRPAAMRSNSNNDFAWQNPGIFDLNHVSVIHQNWSNGSYSPDTFDRDYNQPSTAYSGNIFRADVPIPKPYPPKFVYQHSQNSHDLVPHQPLLYEHYSYPSSDGRSTASNIGHHRHVQLKDKVLSWSHSVYIDLLSYLCENKNGQNSRRNVGVLNSKQIYPRPPRQCAVAFPFVHARLVSSEQSCGGTNDSGNQNAERIHASNLGSQQLPSTSQFQDSSDNVNQSLHWNGKTGSPDVERRRLSVLNNVQAALKMLSNLCEQSTWVDGMLLAGCLEYGLENYDKALQWYLKILEVDSSHVEAISNLAATLLCLNRRDEAEQHWLQAVKLRPSYFEAVEHLIGLLCNGNRAREAVGIIDYVERTLRVSRREETDPTDFASETSSDADRSSDATSASDVPVFDYEGEAMRSPPFSSRIKDSLRKSAFASSGYLIPAAENGRILALVHAKGNMLYSLGDISGAAEAFEDAVLIAAGRRAHGIHGLIYRILRALANKLEPSGGSRVSLTSEALLLPPEMALQTSKLIFSGNGELPGLRFVPDGIPKKAAISTTSNSLLSLAKIFQDGLATTSKASNYATGVADILALYYLSLSLQPSPSTANNVGILLASVQPSSSRVINPSPIKKGHVKSSLPEIPGISPGSGVALALAYYNYGLNLDKRHAHLYTNLGSLLKDIGQLKAAIKMYEHAVACDKTFDIALANLANAVKDEGRIGDAIEYYKRAVAASPNFAEAVCGLANALNSVCDWTGRGGVIHDLGKRDRWHVSDKGELIDGTAPNTTNAGWMKRVVDIVRIQLSEGKKWGQGVLQESVRQTLVQELELSDAGRPWSDAKRLATRDRLASWAGAGWEGARVVRLIERAVRKTMHQRYLDQYVHHKSHPPSQYPRPRIPNALVVPGAPTVLPFHTFTCPLSAKDIRQISQRNALRISCSTLRAPWLPSTVYPVPPPPRPHLNIGYVSSDFNNHPLAHLMQSVFGLHDPSRAKAFCYATTPSDRSVHRQQIEREAPVFHDASYWSAERLVGQIVQDEIHILVNLNGYTRGARNEIFAARPAPVQMSFMGYNGAIVADWCDYLLADEVSIPKQTLRPPQTDPDLLWDDPPYDEGDWVYSENIIFTKDTFFCCDHRQSGPDSQENPPVSWDDELRRRWKMRKEIFPHLPDDAVILGNFNQLYKIEPTIFRTWLRILSQVPKAIIWLLRFPDLGETNLKRMAREWHNGEVASRVVFTDVAPKGQHISRARVCDLFLDTPECNAHTTAADILWSGTPMLTLPRFAHKMCSRMGASILGGALPRSAAGRRAAADLVAADDDDYERRAVRLAAGLAYDLGPERVGRARGRLAELRQMLYEARWSSALFDTRRWVRTVEEGYERAWANWVQGTPGHIYLD